MPIVYHIPLFIILLMSVTGFLMLIVKNTKFHPFMTLIPLTISVVLSFILLLYLLNSNPSFYNYHLGYYPAPWGNELKVTLIESLLALVFLVVILVAQWVGRNQNFQLIPSNKHTYYFLMVNLMVASLVALIYTNDLFSAYVFLEINTIAASSLMMAKLNGHAIRATIKYFMMSAIGSCMFLLGIANLYGLTGHLAMEPMHHQIRILVESGNYLTGITISVILLVVGMSAKSGLFPFHAWSPDGYSQATPANGAILSGVISKVYILLGIKVIYRVFGLEIMNMLGIMPVFFWLGLISMLFGSILAYYQRDIYRRIAYSSVSQIGYIFTAIGMGTPFGIATALFHMIHHSLSKAIIFLSIGRMTETIQSLKVSEYTGLGAIKPYTTISFTIASLSIVGIPPTMGFNGKWYLVENFIQSPYVWAIVILSISTLLSAAYWLPIIARNYFSDRAMYYRVNRAQCLESSKDSSVSMLLVSAALIIMMTFFSRPLYDLFLEQLPYFETVLMSMNSLSIK